MQEEGEGEEGTECPLKELNELDYMWCEFEIVCLDRC